MAAKKSSSKGRASKQQTPAKRAAKKQAAKKKAAKKKAAGKKAAKQKTPAPAASKSGVSAMDVTLGHIFALRPRVDRSFRKTDLGQAKRNLEDESYVDLHEAARAVAEEALDITRGAAQRPSKRRR